MSENIQSIANGTYVIGETSATNFIGGPGIKVDSPSEGVVRIGNDETVLFENSTGSTAFAVSEPLSAFEYLKVSATNNQDALIEAYRAGNNLRFGCCQYTNSADANPLQIFGAYYTTNDGVNYTCQGGHQIYFAKTGASIGGGNSRLIPIKKIIGINRKEV